MAVSDIPAGASLRESSLDLESIPPRLKIWSFRDEYTTAWWFSRAIPPCRKGRLSLSPTLNHRRPVPPPEITGSKSLWCALVSQGAFISPANELPRF